ncbi:MAG: ATP-binding protein, partial [Candidatus Sericytochromatia bacterium]
LDMLSRRLTRKDFQVMTAESGRVALALLEKEPVDLVLLDLMMPEMDGIEVLGHIRKRFSMAHLPVIVVTAKSEREHLVEAFDAGANDYIAKPIDFEVLLARTRSHIEHRYLELSLRASEAQYRDLFDHASDLIFSFNAAGEWLYFNPSLERCSGFQAEELQKTSCFDLFSAPSQSWETLLAQARQRGGASQLELLLKTAKGADLFLEGNLSARERQGNLEAYRGIFHDISARKQAESMKNAFVSMVSHELRTPLTSIRGSLSLILKGLAGPLNPDMTELLDISHRNSERLIFLINDILDIEKIEAGKMDFHFERLSLRELAEQALKNNQAYADQYQVTYHLEPVAHVAWIRGDRERLSQVLANLLSNAAKFSHPQGQVTLSISPQENGGYRLTVKDQGSGIPATFHNQIFSKFAQADNSSTRSKGGTGLGLAISKEIIEKHGGKLDFCSEPGQTRFYFDLPPAEEN